MAIVQDLVPRIKGFMAQLLKPDTFVILVVLVTGIGAFVLGRYSAFSEVKPAQVHESMGPAAAVVAEVPTAPKATSGAYVASSGGTKYYLPSCSGVSRISEENKVWFTTKAEAEAAGYTPSANCKGL